MQKFNVCNHFPENCTESHFSESSLRNRPFNKQSRSPCQREALNDTNKLLVIDREERFLLVGNTDSRWSVFAGLVDLTLHGKQDYKQALKQSMLPKCFGKGACPATFSVYEDRRLHALRIGPTPAGSMHYEKAPRFRRPRL